jgi:uncharacterized membrane protein YfcA
VIKINQGLFENIIAILLILAIPLIFFNRNVGLNEKRGITQLRLIFGMFLSMLASFIGGLFALTGLWFNYVYLYLGLTFKQIAGTRKIIGSITGIISSIMLIVAGLINWPIAIVMFIASVLGGWLGATIGIRVDNIWIKNLFLLIAMASAIKILFF